jgi:hypothetical protein
VPSRLNRLVRQYVTFAVCFTNVIVLLVLINVGFVALRWVYRLVKSDQIVALRQAYPGKSDDEIRALFAETWSGSWQYSSWVGFRETPRRGPRVNVTDEGYRLTHRKDLDLGADGIKVFVFGGSTTFGYGVADEETIPAWLQKRLDALYPDRKIQVFNFGRGYYFSTQEVTLLQQLLREGKRPDIAVFVDGLNEGQREPYYYTEMSLAFEGLNTKPSVLLRMYADTTATSRGLKKILGKKEAGVLEQAVSPQRTVQIFEHNRRVVRLLAREFDFTSYFFIQPIPAYRNSFGKHPFLPNGWPPGVEEHLTESLTLMDRLVDGKDTFSLTGLFEKYSKLPFVDELHYTSAACDMIAAGIARELRIPQR